MAVPVNTSIITHFQTFEDPRIERTQKHRLLDILFIALCILSSGGCNPGVTVPPQGTIHTVAPGADLQGTINATAAGDTVVFSPGTYTITRPLTLKSGVLYQGACAAVLANATNAPTLVTVDANDSSNIRLDGLIFDGGSLTLAGTAASTSVNNITVVNSTFKNLYLGDLEAGIFGVYVKNSTIAHNRFLNLQGGQGIFMYHLDRSQLTYNACVHVHQCISLQWESLANTGRDVAVAFNAGTDIERMGLELADLGVGSGPQGSTVNLLVEGNWFAGWTGADANRIAYSIVPNLGINTIVRNNYGNFAASGRGDFGLELAGTGAQATGNDFRNFNTGVECYQPNQVVTTNNLVNCVDGGSDVCVDVYTSQSYGNTIQNNTNNPSQPIPPPPVPLN